MFAERIIPEECSIIRIRAVQFEEKMIREILKFEIYRPTIYEVANDFLAEMTIVYLIKLILHSEIPPGTSLRTIWLMYSKLLTQVNRIPSPNNSPHTPIVSLITAK